MKRIIIFASLMVFAIASSYQVSGQKADFNGIWKLDMTKSTVAQYTPILLRIHVKINGDTLLTERFYDTGDDQEYPFTENLTIDGKEYNIIIYDMPRKSKASWSDQDGSVLVESTTTFNGDSGSEDFISKEVWKADAANKTLTISFKNSMAGNDADGVFIFNKAEQEK
jgi:hypothetical protein